jgi:hypothetical protein
VLLPTVHIVSTPSFLPISYWTLARNLGDWIHSSQQHGTTFFWFWISWVTFFVAISFWQHVIYDFRLQVEWLAFIFMTVGTPILSQLSIMVRKENMHYFLLKNIDIVITYLVCLLWLHFGIPMSVLDSSCFVL